MLIFITFNFGSFWASAYTTLYAIFFYIVFVVRQ